MRNDLSFPPYTQCAIPFHSLSKGTNQFTTQSDSFHIVLILKLSSQSDKLLISHEDVTHTSILLLFQTFPYKVSKFSLLHEYFLLQQSQTGSPIYYTDYYRLKVGINRASDNRMADSMENRTLKLL